MSKPTTSLISKTMTTFMNEVPVKQIVEHDQRSKSETTTTSMSKPTTTSMMRQQGTIKTKQQLLAKEVFSPQITKFRRERIIPLYKDETWSADLIDKSSLSKYNNNYIFLLAVMDIFTKYAWAILLKNKSGLSLTNGFKIVLGESRKPEKLWVDSEFYNKTFISLLKKYETELYST